MTLRRFLWTVQYLVGAGFYVIPAYQPADNSVDNTVLSVPAMFQRNWGNLWAAITDLPSYQSALKGRVLLDLLSEPDQFKIRWESGALRKGFQYARLLELYINAMNVSTTDHTATSQSVSLSSLCCLSSLPPVLVVWLVLNGEPSLEKR